jgi:hypothetical protein
VLDDHLNAVVIFLDLSKANDVLNQIVIGYIGNLWNKENAEMLV